MKPRNQKLTTPTLIRILRRLVRSRAFQQRKAKLCTSGIRGRSLSGFPLGGGISPLRVAVSPAAKQAVVLQSNAITPLQSVVITMQQRAEHHVDRMAGVTEKVLPHLESMQPDSILNRVHDIEKYDRMARRNYGLLDNEGRSSSLSLNVLAGGGRTRIAIDQQPNQTPAQDQA
jgi:hypothetical protein